MGVDRVGLQRRAQRSVAPLRVPAQPAGGAEVDVDRRQLDGAGVAAQFGVQRAQRQELPGRRAGRAVGEVDAAAQPRGARRGEHDAQVECGVRQRRIEACRIDRLGTQRRVGQGQCGVGLHGRVELRFAGRREQRAVQFQRVERPAAMQLGVRARVVREARDSSAETQRIRWRIGQGAVGECIAPRRRRLQAPAPARVGVMQLAVPATEPARGAALVAQAQFADVDAVDVDAQRQPQAARRGRGSRRRAVPAQFDARRGQPQYMQAAAPQRAR
ncbi:hypothetical protein GALL_356640 [mine drainage metagenome]|uniref:Uncharacterized protein n=1 Tax=mine drainage metagenome TaxID=410659 RepID=A0A1J5QH21_9ZZZZ